MNLNPISYVNNTSNNYLTESQDHNSASEGEQLQNRLIQIK